MTSPLFARDTLSKAEVDALLGGAPAAGGLTKRRSSDADEALAAAARRAPNSSWRRRLASLSAPRDEWLLPSEVGA